MRLTTKRFAEALLLLLAFGLWSPNGTTITPPCDDIYGTQMDRVAIQEAMFDDDADGVQEAIERAKRTRAVAVGCPERDYATRIVYDAARPALSEVREHWDGAYLPALEALQPSCPHAGRSLGAIALGAQYARLGGFFADADSLDDIARLYEASQYARKRVARLTAEPGVFGYFHAEEPGDACALDGLTGEGAAFICTQFPQYCPEYLSGDFAGKRFAVKDHGRIDGELVGDLGGAGFDTGWAGVMMIEAAIQAQDPAIRQVFRESALLAGEWAKAQPPVANHNYTAKLIWLLAELYNWTGREDFRDAMLDKLERNLVPGVLMDLNGDGFVDGMGESVRFEDLAPVAQVPGRMWDGHNALPWYQSKNAWAMLKAYVALRDRGDVELAAKYRPYAVAMIDNLAHEYVELGVPEGQGLAWTDMPFAILLGIWKLAQFENDPQPLWEQAAWALWDSGELQSGVGPRGVNIPLYLLILSQTPYRSLHERSNGTQIRHGLWFDPDYNGHGLEIHRAGNDLIVFFYTYDNSGEPEWYLGVAPMAQNRTDGRLDRFTYRNGSASADPAHSATFSLDFSRDSSGECDGESGQSVAFDSSLFQGVWCLTLLEFDSFERVDDYRGGVWYGGIGGSGYGVSISHMGKTLSTIAYYYDGSGQPRWALGSGGQDDAVIALQHYRGYCRDCMSQPITPQIAGSLQLHWNGQTHAAQSRGIAVLDLIYPQTPFGRFFKEFALWRLSDATRVSVPSAVK